MAVRGSPASSVNDLAAAVADTYADSRGWSAAGLNFVQVPSGGDFTVWLAQASTLPSFGSPCDSTYSCTQGRNVIINDDRFRTGSPHWPGPLAEYRHMVINHETGHWLGFGHSFCAARRCARADHAAAVEGHAGLRDQPVAAPRRDRQ